EQLGRYYTKYYRQLAADKNPSGIDFRAIRFPGLISAVTTPTGGTSDYGPEMLHHAAMGKKYRCFVRPDTRLPFMVMPDAIKALLDLEKADQSNLSKLVYNVTSFNPSAQEFYDIVVKAFPNAEINFEPDIARQGIVDTWPADVDDNAAATDWGWGPDYDQDRAFNEYLLPAVKARYL
ncbi:MAG: epimerase, partial [Anaerolineaceae bacterium]|nr:epimerase [Anaerolineaceae bacterium]